MICKFYVRALSTYMFSVSLLLLLLLIACIYSYTPKKTCFWGIHCCSYPVVTICAACNVSSHVGCFVRADVCVQRPIRMAVFCSSFISCFPLYSAQFFFPEWFKMIPITPIVTGVSLLLHYYYYYYSFRAKLEYVSALWKTINSVYVKRNSKASSWNFLTLCYKWFFSPDSFSCTYVNVLQLLICAICMTEGINVT